MNTSPPAVTIGPPMFGMPSVGDGTNQGVMSRVEPSITCQRIALRRRSTAASVPHGGAVHGRPNGEASISRRMP